MLLAFLTTGWARWLVFPPAVAMVVLTSPGSRVLGLGCFAAGSLSGFVDQRVRQGDLSARWRRATVVVVTLALLVLVPVELVRIPHDTTPLDYVMFFLAGLAGIIVGVFLAGFRSRNRTGRPPEQALSSSVTDLLADAINLRGFRPLDVRGEVEVPTRRPVEAFVDGDWRRAELIAWDTRDLGLVARVSLRRGGVEHEEWISAERVRPVGGPAGPEERGK